MYDSGILLKNYIRVYTKIFLLELISRKLCITAVFVCDTEDYMENMFGNYFLGDFHFSAHKECFPLISQQFDTWSVRDPRNLNFRTYSLTTLKILGFWGPLALDKGNINLRSYRFSSWIGNTLPTELSQIPFQIFRVISGFEASESLQYMKVQAISR